MDWRSGPGKAGQPLSTVLFYRDAPVVRNGVDNVGYFLPLALQTAGYRVLRFPYVTGNNLQLFPLATLARRLRVDAPRLLHLNCVPTKLDWVLLRALRVTRCPTTLFIHGDLGAEMAWNGNLSAAAQVTLARWLRFQQHVSKVVVASQFMRQRLVSGYGLSDESVVVIPNGVSISEYRKTGRAESRRGGFLLYVGGLWRMKGVDILLRAAAELCQKHSELRLGVVGGGAEAQALMKLACESGLHDRVAFYGPLPMDRLRRLYSQAMALVLPSRSESFGIVLLEAMASGLPIVAARTGGIPEIVTDGENGLLFEPESVEGLKTALEKLITEPLLRRRMMERGLQTAMEYDWAEIGPRYGTLFARILEEGS